MIETDPPATPAPQAWHSRRVVWFQGFADSLLAIDNKAGEKLTAEERARRKAEVYTEAEANGELYPTISLYDIFHFTPTAKSKSDGPAFIPSLYDSFDAREHNAQRERGQFVALTADIDKGDHDHGAIGRAIAAFAPKTACVIYSSPHSRPGDKRWRVVMPLAEPQVFHTWHDAQQALYAFLEARQIVCDRALARAAQPVFLPNVPQRHEKSGTELRGEDGKPLFYKALRTSDAWSGLDLESGPVQQGIAAIRKQRAEDEATRDAIRREAEQRRANAPRGDNASLIDDFNAENSVATMLEICGYEQSPRSAEDWRSPQQTGETFATRIIGSKWVSLSDSDASSGLGSRCSAGCYGDAYDLFVHYKHGGDHKAAYRQIGAERRAAQGNVTYPPQFHAEPPEWMDEAPSYEAMPEWVDMGEPDSLEVPGSNQPTLPRLPHIWFNQAEPNLEANDFVEGLLTTGSMSVVYGPSNCGKTFFIVDLALHVAMGRQWRGRDIDRGAVVYLALEGSQGIRNRLSAFRRHHNLGDTPLPFAAMPKPVNLLNEDADVNAVIELTRYVEGETGMPVAMVIVDTLSRAMAGGNENSPEDMTALIGNCDRIRHDTGAHVCIVHHSGKDEARGARGHSSLRAATDTEIEIKRDPELTFSSVRVAKQRDLEAADPFAFTLQKVALGTNRRGKDVSSCVVIESDQTVLLARDPDKLSPKETAALESLERCLVAGGFEIKNVTDRAVTLHSWKRSLQATDVIDRNSDDKARPQFHRIRKGLEKKGQIEISEGNVWLA